MTDPIIILYEGINQPQPIATPEDEHITHLVSLLRKLQKRYPDKPPLIDIDTVAKTNYEQIHWDADPMDNIDPTYRAARTTGGTTPRFTMHWYLGGSNHRNERDPKTGLLLPSYIDYMAPDCYVTTWSNSSELLSRKEVDPKTGISLPAKIARGGKNGGDWTMRWFFRHERHREDGPAFINDLGEEEFWLDNQEIDDVRDYVKDHRVAKKLLTFELEDKDIKDDDFLRSFGRIL